MTRCVGDGKDEDENFAADLMNEYFITVHLIALNEFNCHPMMSVANFFECLQMVRSMMMMTFIEAFFGIF